MTGPYADAYDAYRRAGWVGVIPLPARKKSHPPSGVTGEGGMWPSYADCHAWGEGPEGRGNIALRLPHHILGVDVDAYGDKPGAATLAAAEQHHGALPATWRTTSRDDGESGIRLYRVPEGLAWPGEIGDGTELIQYRHRYAVVWPSIHPEGRTYRWITPEGVTSTAIPDPDALPLLPEPWTLGLTGGQQAAETRRNTYDDDETRQWIVANPGATDPPCARMQRAIDTTVAELSGGGSAHNAARDGALRFVRLAHEGHPGAVGALAAAYQAFLPNVTAAHRAGPTRDVREAKAEWGRAVSSAVNLVTANPSGVDTCDCAGQLTGLVVGGAYPTTGTAALTPLQAPDPTRDDNTEPDAETTRERTSWWPRNLNSILAGQQEEPPPAHLQRDDGERLLYTGKINGLLGESESGKTWVALLAAAQALTAGQIVTYLDFEDTAPGIVSRLRAMTLPDDDLARFAYIGPDETLHAAASDDLRETLEQTRPDLIVLDGVNAAMTLLALDLDRNKDATQFNQMLLKPLAAAGAAVVVVDHIPKNRENRGKGGIGAQAKRAMMTGAAIVCDVIEPFGRGMTGRLRLTVDKDRPGHVRAVSAEAKRVGVAVLESDSETGMVHVSIQPPDTTTTTEKQRGRIAMLMEDISTYLAGNPARTSLAGIREATGRRRDDVNQALETLIRYGHVEREDSRGARGGGFDHRLVRPFTVAEDLTTPTLPNPAQPYPRESGEDRPQPYPGTAPPPFREGAGSGTVRSVASDTAAIHEAAGNGSDSVEDSGYLIDPRTGEILSDTTGADQ